MRKKYQSLRLEDQIFAIILTCAMAMSIALIVVNIIIDYPMIANVKWVISLIMSGFVLYVAFKATLCYACAFHFLFRGDYCIAASWVAKFVAHQSVYRSIFIFNHDCRNSISLKAKSNFSFLQLN